MTSQEKGERAALCGRISDVSENGMERDDDGDGGGGGAEDRERRAIIVSVVGIEIVVLRHKKQNGREERTTSQFDIGP